MTNEPGAADSAANAKKHAGMSRAEFEARVKGTFDQIEEVNDKINARSGRNLFKATLIGLALGLVMIFSLVMIKEIFVVFAAVILAFTAFELASALRHAGRDIPRIPTVLAAVAIGPAAYYWGPAGQWIGILASILLVVLWRLAELIVPRHRAPLRSVAHDLSGSVFVQVYVTFLGSIAVLLLAQPNGQWWVLSFLLVIIATDTGAYVSGLNFGKHLMAPTISPKKTWEGFVGSLVAAGVASVLLSVFLLDKPWWFGLIFGIVLAIAATIGDFTESMLKRDLGIKDMSTWLPGHGGFLDRLDSILPSAAVAYAFYIIFT